MSNVSLQCEGCGQVFERREAEVSRSRKLGRKFFCSLQCLGKHRNNSVYKHTGDASWLTPSNRRDAHTPFRWYMRTIKYRSQYSKSPRKQTDLVIGDLVDQWNQQGGVCPYTGWRLTLPDSTIGWREGMKPANASVDRVDSTKGYIKGNIMFVAVMYNYAKNAFGDHEVLAFCKAVTDHSAK